jgi:hypothetical protein
VKSYTTRSQWIASARFPRIASSAETRADAACRDEIIASGREQGARGRGRVAASQTQTKLLIIGIGIAIVGIGLFNFSRPQHHAPPPPLSGAMKRLPRRTSVDIRRPKRDDEIGAMARTCHRVPRTTQSSASSAP